MPATLTELERKILDYMVLYLRTNTYQPSIREIGSRFAIKSTKTVSEHLQALADKGFLERDPSRSRGVKILGMDLHADTISVPCYRELPDDRVGIRTDRAEMFLTVDRRMAGSKGSFFVRARGDDLAFMGAYEGDFLLIEPDQMPGSILEFTIFSFFIHMYYANIFPGKVVVRPCEPEQISDSPVPQAPSASRPFSRAGGRAVTSPAHGAMYSMDGAKIVQGETGDDMTLVQSDPGVALASLLPAALAVRFSARALL